MFLDVSDILGSFLVACTNVGRKRQPPPCLGESVAPTQRSLRGLQREAGGKFAQWALPYKAWPPACLPRKVPRLRRPGQAGQTGVGLFC